MVEQLEVVWSGAIETAAAKAAALETTRNLKRSEKHQACIRILAVMRREPRRVWDHVDLCLAAGLADYTYRNAVSKLRKERLVDGGKLPGARVGTIYLRRAS